MILYSCGNIPTDILAITPYENIIETLISASRKYDKKKTD